MSDTPVRSLPTALYWSGLAALAMLMLATRFHHFGDALHLPDASMAIFLCGGLYLAARESGARVHGAFFALAALAGVIDWIAIARLGVSDFCVTPAYACLLPAYAVLWYGARAFARSLVPTSLRLPVAGGVAALLVTLSFSISNASFYWLGGRIADTSLAGFAVQWSRWAPSFIGTAMAYIAAALLAHALWRRVTRTRPIPQYTGV